MAVDETSAANERGRKAFWDGKPCDPNIPLKLYEDFGEEDRTRYMESWMNGWTDESLMQSLPDGSPA